VTTVAAPRIDPRLRRFIAGSARRETPAEITRAVGALAWSLGLVRPSYQQVRVLARTAEAPPTPGRRSAIDLAFDAVGATLDFLYQYPGPGMEDWYRRWKAGPTRPPPRPRK
jgi:hypothetical protein